MDEHCRITVVGERRQVDLAVPAGAPIASYVGTLARLCEQEEADIMPSAWSLATETTEPFAPEWSLTELGIVDGQVLYLRDMIADEYTEPVVRDVGEQVAQAAQGPLDHHWNARTRTIALTVLGLGWLVATLIVVAVRDQVSPGALAAEALAAGLVLPGLAWIAAERAWRLPRALSAALALCAVPVLALVAQTLAATNWGERMDGPHAPMTSAGLTTCALVVGALVGAFLAYAGAPGVATAAVLVGAVVAAVLGCFLAWMKADTVQSAAVVAVVAFGLLTVAPALVGRIVAFVSRRAEARRPASRTEDTVAAAVRSATVLLVLWSGALAAVLATTLVVLADSRSAYAAGAAGCLGLALLLRAGAVRLVAEVVPVGLAGVVGLFALLLVGSGHFGWPAYAGPLYGGVTAAALLIYGFRRAVRRPELPPMRRPQWLTGLGTVLAGVSVALTAGTLGLADWLLDLGRHM
ncbi:EsaB/YukD family protein [Streptomyces tsukubensis]|uniref:EccD-like transmembrane domain-containing protein n=1 Tax=Streptomyces tsukubensis TaxID=83656 RepID=A0A1V4A5X6_9ACTN|nr:EsaB/YukD family protein [Streptomyces tsukubensis]OON76177.1 hypothetical protein B1H18_21355 [Streptomyces tsukubensis]QFR93703.1 hypothetical protein GBW32_12170 [Streptomyces tsukubensis]